MIDLNAINTTAMAWLDAVSEGDRYVMLAGRRWADGSPMSEDEAMAMARALATLVAAPYPDMDELQALALEFGDYYSHGWKVVPFDPRDHSRGWMLLDPDGGQRQIGEEGCVARRKSSAILEAYRRIAQDVESARVLATTSGELWGRR